MKLWLISQEENQGYDTFDSAVVTAETEEQARQIHPGGYYEWKDRKWTGTRPDGSTHTESFAMWASSPDLVKVEYLGETEQAAKIICASFNAG